MTTPELCDLTIDSLLDLLARREVSALEVTESALDRIAAVDGRPGMLDCGLLDEEDRQRVHAFITLTAERARSQAREVDADRKSGLALGPLAGVPYTVKDIFCVRDTPSTAASRILANFSAPYTATAVERLNQAGAVMLGKVNLDEFTYGSSSESSAFQPCPRNPWDTSRVAGGSSGGSAAAVAAGEGALSLGTDTAGSIRQPAAFCGVVGVKPTYGRVSRYGLIAFASSLDCPGPLARDISGAARMLEAMAGADARDATSVNAPVDRYHEAMKKGVKGLRIGLSPDYFRITVPHPDGTFAHADLPEEISRPVWEAARQLERLGAEIITDVPMPNTRHGIPAYFVISRVEAASNLHRYDGVKYGHRTAEPIDDLRSMYRRSRAEAFGSQPKLRILMGMYVSAAQYSEQYYQKAQRVRGMIRQDFNRIFDRRGKYGIDALLTPTTPTTAFPFGAVYGDSVLMQYADQFTVPSNHAGIPGLAMPAGLDGAGMPVSIQLLGRDFEESVLFRIGWALEQATADAAWRAEKPRVLQSF